MNLRFARLVSILMALVFSANNAFAHHIMGGRTPATFGEGMLSGLGHPVIGLDHFAAVVAVGCIAAMHSAGAALVWGIGLSCLVYGVPIDSDGDYAGDFWDLFSPYTVFAGVAVVLLFAFHGATFLTLRTAGYAWRFVDISGRVLDAGSAPCH